MFGGSAFQAADRQAYLDQVKVDLPEMPWDTVTRLTGHYGVAKRDVETLLALDEYEGAGIKYLEEVTGGDAKLGKRAINWYVGTRSMPRNNKSLTCSGSHMSFSVNWAGPTPLGRPTSCPQASCASLS